MAIDERPADTYVLRDATPADHDALTELINAAYRVEDFFKLVSRYIDGDLEADVAVPGAKYRVAARRDTGEIVGAIYLLIDEEGCGGNSVHRPKGDRMLAESKVIPLGACY